MQITAPETHLHLNLLPEQLQGTAHGQAIDATSTIPPQVQAHGFSGGPSWYLAARSFIDAVQQGNPDLIRSTYRDGVRTLALTLTADEVTRTNRMVGVPQIQDT